MRARVRAWLDDDGGRRRWALVLAGCVLALLLGTLRGAGLTDDDDFYAPAGISYIRWAGSALTARDGAWTRAQIDRAFEPNHEHPPMAKYVMGASWWVFTDVLHVLPTLDGARAGVSLLAALLAYVVASLGWMLRRRWGAVTAVLCLFLLPRFFFHSQVATLDVPVASLTTLAGYLAWKGRRSGPHAWGAAVAFGAALLTKLNAPFLLVAVVLHWLLRSWRGFAVSAGKLTLPPVPVTLPRMILVGPVLFLALWPHLWFDTVPRLGAYLQYHLKHYPIYLYYLGTLYTQTIPPWHVPWVMFVAVVPSTVLVLMLLGAGGGARALWREATAAAPLPPDDDTERDSLRAFLFIQAFIAIGIVSFTGVPKYGGEKLFMPLFPLVAVLAADGAATVAASLGRWMKDARVCRALPTGLAAVHAAWALWSSYPFPLSYYGEAILGPRGAEALGMENTYYDVADKDLALWISRDAPAGARVHFEPNHKEYVRTWGWLARDGYLRTDIRTSDEANADYVVLTHERRWNTYAGLAARYRTLPVVHERTLDGVRLYTVYRRR
ncbi:MAG: glycosyltransferase family 39 protein [Deltaproteobacteria bacterium]|nr:glycosyltransferase family 39 protein [Deltaproteobacteria bacterium]